VKPLEYKKSLKLLQRNSKNDLPPVFGIIGGKGLMGRWLEAILKEYGIAVLISDCNTELTNQDLVKKSNGVILSVPISEVEAVLTEIQDLLTEDKVLIEITSIKSMLIPVLQSLHCEVISLHPMFGPYNHNPKDEKILISKVREKEYTKIFEELFIQEGYDVVPVRLEEHDELMAIVQSVIHCTLISLGLTFKALSKNSNAMQQYRTSIFRIIDLMTGRILSQNAQLYADISIMNKNQASRVLSIFHKEFERIQKAVVQGEKEDFKALFQEALMYLQDENGAINRDKYIQDSQFLIDALKQR
jgi:prephenate dehydrogenase